MTTADGITITPGNMIWNGSPVTVYEGPMQVLREHIPTYERRTFGPSLQPITFDPNNSFFEEPSRLSGINHYHDVIVRMPSNNVDPKFRSALFPSNMH